jgi:hypothetical protein
VTASPDGSGLEAALRALAEAQVRTEERLAELAATEARTDERLAASQARTDEQFRELAAAQARTDEQFRELAAAQARTDEQFRELAAAQARTDEQFRELAAAQARTDERLAAAQARTDERFAELALHLQALTDQVAGINGWVWEWRYRLHAPAYFSRILRRLQVLTPERLAPILDGAVAAGQLSEGDADEVEHADLVCRGRRLDTDETAYLVVEVSAGVGPSDVERAARRAALLARTGTPALAVVAGQRLTPRAIEMAQQLGVWQVTNGTAVQPSRPG